LRRDPNAVCARFCDESGLVDMDIRSFRRERCTSLGRKMSIEACAVEAPAMETKRVTLLPGCLPPLAGLVPQKAWEVRACGGICACMRVEGAHRLAGTGLFSEGVVISGGISVVISVVLRIWGDLV